MTAVAERAEAHNLPRLAINRWTITFALVGVAGIALRVWTYRSAAGVPDSDEAVVGLMVRHALHGQFSTFFWGQAYGGTQEVLLTVPVFAIFGSSWLALRIVPILLSGIAALLLWRVGLRLMSPRAAQVAAALFWIWPPFLIYKLTHQWGFYASGVVYCALFLLLALRIVESPSTLRVGLFGLVFGLGIWQSEQLAPIALPLIAWTIWKQPSALRKLWIAVPAAALGLAPWLVWNIGHGWQSFHSTVPDTTSYPHRLRIFVSPLLPIVLGLREAFDEKRIIPSSAATYLIEAALVALFLYGAWRTRRQLRSVLFVVAAVYPFVYAISPETLLSGDAKYVVVLMPVLVLLVAQLATTYPRALALILLALTASVVSLDRMATYFRTVPQQPPVAPRNIRPLIATLDRFGLNRVYATFWVAYRLDFDTNERIIAAQNKIHSVRFVNGTAIPPDDPYARYKPYQTEVKAAPRHGFVVFRAAAGDAKAAIASLDAHGWRRVVVGPFFVFAPPASSTSG